MLKQRNHVVRLNYFSGLGVKVIFYLILGFFFFMAFSTAYSAGPKHGGTLIHVLAGEEAHFNPNLIPGASVMPVARNIFNSLMYQGWDDELVPSLAESWKVSPDGLSYTFNLVKNATWHDGKPFTSADVVFTIKEVMPLHPRAGRIWKKVEAVALDDYTVVLKLEKLSAPFLVSVAAHQSAAYILPKHLYEGTDIKKNPYNSKPIGTGPFVFKKWERGRYVELVRNDNYFAKGKENKPYLDRIIFQLIPDASARILALKKGELDFIYTQALSMENVPELRKDPNIVVDTRGAGSLSIKWLFFNTRKPPLSNKLVRQAIAHAIDKEQILKVALRGEGRIAKSMVNSLTPWAFNPNVPDYPFNIEKANELLDKAGYPKDANGIRFSQRLHCIPGRGSDGRVAEVIRDQLKQVGIDARIIGTDRASFVNTMFRLWDFDMAFQQGATAPDPAIGVARFIHSKEIRKAAFVNASAYSNPEVDKLLDQEVTELDIKKRADMWYKIQNIVMEELPMLPIYEATMVNVYRKGWVDLITTSNGHNQTREHAYKE